MTTRYTLDTRDRPGLLFAMMRVFASDQSRIAFEGNLAATELYRLEKASYEETEILKRATIAPRLDFVVMSYPEVTFRETCPNRSGQTALSSRHNEYGGHVIALRAV